MENRGNTSRLRMIVLTALFAAVIFITTAYLLHIPTGLSGGYIHLGDAFIYVAACILPWPYAMAAASFGAGLSDMVSPGGAVYVPATLIIKAIMVLYFSKSTARFFNRRNLIACVLAGVTGIVGYFIATGIIVGNFLAALVTLPIDLIQPIASAGVFIVIAKVFDKINLKRIIKNIL